MNRIFLVAVLALTACDTASSAVIDNQFPDTFTVTQVWWQTTQFTDRVAPMQRSDSLRTVPGTATVWALVEADPDVRLAVKSIAPLTLAERGDELRIEISPTTVTGLCGSNGALTADDADTAARIFPAELIGRYDPVTCTYVDPP